MAFNFRPRFRRSKKEATRSAGPTRVVIPVEPESPQFIEGALRDQGIAIVLQLLAMSKSCGKLTVAAPGDVTRIGLAHGWVLNASRDFGPKVGDELIARGILSRPDLDTVLAMQKRKKVPEPLGDILAGLGLVDRQTMDSIVRGHVLDILREMEVLRCGTFRFEECDDLTRASALPDTLRIERLLAELAASGEPLVLP